MHWGVSRVSSCWPVTLVELGCLFVSHIKRLYHAYLGQYIVSRVFSRVSLYSTNPCQRRSCFLWLWVLKTWGQQWFVTINAYSISVTLTRDTWSSSVTWSQVQKSCVWENTTWNKVFLAIIYLMMIIAWLREALLLGLRLYSRIVSCTFWLFSISFLKASFCQSKRALVKFYPKVSMKINTMLLPSTR